MSTDSPVAGHAVGIDLGARDLWIVMLSGTTRPYVQLSEHLGSSDLEQLRMLLGGVATVAIDAPESLSAGSHIGDARLARKFQRARCSEVALRTRGIAVPFATPMPGETVPTWMLTGFATWQAARDAAPRVVETFPHGIFWQLAGRPLLHKQRPEGRAARREALARVIDLPVGVDYWPHDALDATACAFVAWQLDRGEAERISCVDDSEWTAHDGSEMWLAGASA